MQQVQGAFLIVTGTVIRPVTETSLDHGIAYSLNLKLTELKKSLKRARNPMRKLTIKNEIETVNSKLLLWEK